MLSHLQNQTVTLAAVSSKDRYGRDSFGSAVSHKVRVNEKTKDIFLPNGETVTIEANCYFAPDVTISVDDKVTYNSNDYKVWTKKIVRDMVGETHHIKVQLIKWQS